jgi:hypothetical protein
VILSGAERHFGFARTRVGSARGGPAFGACRAVLQVPTQCSLSSPAKAARSVTKLAMANAPAVRKNTDNRQSLSKRVCLSFRPLANTLLNPIERSRQVC